MPQHNSILTGVASMAILTIISKIVRLLVLMVTARYLTSEDFGVIAAFSMVLALAYLFANGGVVKTIIQRPDINRSHIAGAIFLCGLYSSVVILILLFLSDDIERLVGVNGISLPLKISSFLFILLALSNICSAISQRNGDAVLICKIQVLCNIFGNICVTIPLLWFDFGYWSIIIGLFASEVISMLFITWQGKSFLSLTMAKNEAFEIIKYSSAFLLHNTIDLVSRQIDIALIGRFLGKADLGNYSRSMQLIEFPSQIYWLTVDRVVFPSMSAMKTDKDKLRQFFLDIYSLLLLVLGIGAIVLFYGAQAIVDIIMGKGWDLVVLLLQILAVNVVLKCITGFIDSFLGAYGEIKHLTYKNLISLIVFSISLFIGVKFGLEGAAYAVVFAGVSNFIISTFIVIYYTHISIRAFVFASTPTFLTLIMITFIYQIISFIMTIPNLVSILISVLLWATFCYLIPSKKLLSLNGKNYILQIKLKGFNSHG